MNLAERSEKEDLIQEYEDEAKTYCYYINQIADDRTKKWNDKYKLITNYMRRREKFYISRANELKKELGIEEVV